MPTRFSHSNLKEKKRKTRKRPVLQFRIPEAEYRELARTAAKSDLTISEEAARRLLAYSMMERKPDMQEEAAKIELVRLYHECHASFFGIRTRCIAVASIEELLVKAAKMGAEQALKSLQK